MYRRTYVTIPVLVACLVLPVIIGASCPPPNNPPFLAITAPATGGVGLAACEEGRVCVSIVNEACADAEVMLYVHDGYDLAGNFITRVALECCEDENATAPCPCFRDGFDIGELQLRRPELFIVANRFRIAGDVVYDLPGRASILASRGGSVQVNLDCEEVKSIGLEVGPNGSLPVGPPEDRQGPDYRCTQQEFQQTQPRALEHVACGETIQFTIEDRNNCVDPTLTVFRIARAVSGGCQ